MASRVPPTDHFGRLNAERERVSRGVNDALRIGGDQYADLGRRIDQLNELVTSQAAIITALQPVSGSSSGVTTFTGSSSGLVWESFNGSFDVSLSVTTGASGKIIVSPSARLVNVNATATPIIDVEVVGVTSLAWPDNPKAIYLGANAGATLGRSAQIDLTPNTTYTVRTRRGRYGIGSGLECSWGYQNLLVQRIP